MPTYSYQAIGSAGGADVIEAPDRASAVRMLLERGVTPRRVEEVRTGGRTDATARAGALLGRRPVRRTEMAALVRELAVATSAGLPLVPALRTIARQGRSDAQRRLLEALIGEVEQGRPLSEAMGEQGRVFPELVVNLVGAGESSGRLAEVLAQAATLLDRDVKMRRALMGAMIYPAIIAGAVIVAVIVVVTVIVPRVLAAVEGQLSELPLPTRIVQGVASFFGSYWWLVLGGIALLMLGWSRLYRRAGPRLIIDTALLRTPVLGVLLRDAAVARFTRTLGTLAEAGLPVLAALRITRGTFGNRALEHALDDVCEEVAAGRTIAEPLERSGFFPALLVQIMNLGEQSGRLDEMLIHAADAFEEKTEQSLKLFTTVLPPLLIVVLACMVGFVVLSILLPLIELQEAIG